MRFGAFFLALMAALIVAGAGRQARASTCVLVVEAASGKVLVREGDCETAQSPCSTFKVPLALMGFDAGVLEGPEAPTWSYQVGDLVNTPFDKLDTNPRGWLKNSVVWYSQRLTMKLGTEAFGRYVRGFGYGNQDVSGNPGAGDGLTRSWLGSSLLVTPAQQVEFLRALLAGTLPVKPRATDQLRATMPTFEPSPGWQLFGKTGSCKRRGPNGYDDKLSVGWFVGWAQKGDRHLVFVYQLQDETPSDQPGGPRAREALLKAWEGLVTAPR